MASATRSTETTPFARLRDIKRNANGLPPSLRARVMRRAWEMFRNSYGYPGVPFRSIGQHCFNAVLRLAWEEAREIARMATYGVERLQALKEAASQPYFGTGIRTHFWEAPEKLLARLHAIRLYDAALALAVSR